MLLQFNSPRVLYRFLSLSFLSENNHLIPHPLGIITFNTAIIMFKFKTSLYQFKIFFFFYFVGDILLRFTSFDSSSIKTLKQKHMSNDAHINQVKDNAIYTGLKWFFTLKYNPLKHKTNF